jgi:hypothetical protein
MGNDPCALARLRLERYRTYSDPPSLYKGDDLSDFILYGQSGSSGDIVGLEGGLPWR